MLKYNPKYKCYVSDDGLVYGVKNGNLVLRSLKPFPGKKYIRVYVWDYETDKNISKRLHRLVWETFNGEIPAGMQIDHEDGNPANNALKNLRCVTAKENSNNPNTAFKTKGKKNGMYGKARTEEEKFKTSVNRKSGIPWFELYGMPCYKIMEITGKCHETIVSWHKKGILKEKL